MQPAGRLSAGKPEAGRDLRHDGQRTIISDDKLSARVQRDSLRQFEYPSDLRGCVEGEVGLRLEIMFDRPVRQNFPEGFLGGFDFVADRLSEPIQRDIERAEQERLSSIGPP